MSFQQWLEELNIDAPVPSPLRIADGIVRKAYLLAMFLQNPHPWLEFDTNRHEVLVRRNGSISLRYTVETQNILALHQLQKQLCEPICSWESAIIQASRLISSSRFYGIIKCYPEQKPVNWKRDGF